MPRLRSSFAHGRQNASSFSPKEISKSASALRSFGVKIQVDSVRRKCGRRQMKFPRPIRPASPKTPVRCRSDYRLWYFQFPHQTLTLQKLLRCNSSVREPKSGQVYLGLHLYAIAQIENGFQFFHTFQTNLRFAKMVFSWFSFSWLVPERFKIGWIFTDRFCWNSFFRKFLIHIFQPDFIHLSIATVMSVMRSGFAHYFGNAWKNFRTGDF